MTGMIHVKCLVENCNNKVRLGVEFCKDCQIQLGLYKIKPHYKEEEE